MNCNRIKGTCKQLAAAITAITLATTVCAKLPPQTADDKAKSDQASAKAAWADKVALYQLCLAQDRVAFAYRKSAGKAVLSAAGASLCADPGSYILQVAPAAAKPLEASGAHSPAGLMVSPPSRQSTSAEIADKPKK